MYLASKRLPMKKSKIKYASEKTDGGTEGIWQIKF